MSCHEYLRDPAKLFAGLNARKINDICYGNAECQGLTGN